MTRSFRTAVAVLNPFILMMIGLVALASVLPVRGRWRRWLAISPAG